MDTPTATGGLINEEVQAEEQRLGNENWKTFTEHWTPSLRKSRLELSHTHGILDEFSQ